MVCLSGRETSIKTQGLQLSRQAYKLAMESGLTEKNIRRGTIELCAGEPKCWGLTPKGPWMSVELAALKHFENLGWEGYHREGSLILSLIKACSFPDLPTHRHSIMIEAIYANNVRKPFDVRAMNLQYDIDPDTPPSAEIAEWNRMSEADRVNPSDLVENIKCASVQRIIANFSIMTGPKAHTLSFFPSLTLEKLLSLYLTLGNVRLSKIAAIFATEPYVFRAGWPDLTLWRESDVIFREIKAPGDRLYANQAKTINTVLLPLGFDVEVVNVKPIVFLS